MRVAVGVAKKISDPGARHGHISSLEIYVLFYPYMDTK